MINSRRLGHSIGIANEPDVSGGTRVQVTLLERCQAGDPRAWEEFFRQWTPHVFRWAVLLGLSSAEAEDAVQDVLAIVARCLNAGTKVTWVKAWLFQITRRVVANRRRLGRFWRRLLPLPQTRESGPAFEHSSRPTIELELAVRSCLEKLSRAQVEVLVLVEIEGLTRQEAAAVLGLPEGTVASRLLLAKAAFQDHWTRQNNSQTAALSWESL